MVLFLKNVTIDSLYSCSTNGIFLSPTNSPVSRLIWAAVVSTLIAVLAALRWPEGTLAIVPKLAQLWWMLPLSTSLGSVAALAASAMLAGVKRSKTLSGLSTRSYLVVGPALVSLNLVSLVPTVASAPSWVGDLMLLLLLVSAWLYYLTFKDSDEQRSPSGHW
jgi:hypothetical protein